MKQKGAVAVLAAQENNESTLTDFLNCVCPMCGKRCHLKPYAVKSAKNHYCSKMCLYEAKRTIMCGEGNHQYGLKGSANASWKGGTKINQYGYRLIQQIGHPFATGRSNYVLEHRLVAEKYLLTAENSVEIGGRMYLSPDYVVHHKNGNRLDNRVEHLEVMTRSEHQAMHARKQLEIMKRGDNGRFLRINPDDTPRGSNGFGSTGV